MDGFAYGAWDKASDAQAGTWAAYDERREAYADACKREFQRIGTWEDVCSKADSDHDFATSFEKASMIISGECRMPEDPESLEDGVEYSIQTSRSLTVARAQFQAVTAMTLAQAGIGEQEVDNELGQYCVLCVNPLRSFVEYQVQSTRFVSRASNRLPVERQCTTSQAEILLTARRAKMENEKMFIKARNCTDTIEVLEKAIGVPQLHAKFIHFATSGQEANSSVPGSGTSASVGESNARLGNTAVVSVKPSGSFKYMASPAGSTVSRPTLVLRNASQLHLRESASVVGSEVCRARRTCTRPGARSARVMTTRLLGDSWGIGFYAIYYRWE